MKAYIKPVIEVVTISSSTPIAAKVCFGDNKDDWDQEDEYVDGKDGLGDMCANYVWVRGS